MVSGTSGSGGILQRPKRGRQKSNRQTHSAHGASPDGRHAVCEAACQEPPRPPQRPRRHKEPRHQGVLPESVLPVERHHDARHHDGLGGTDSMTYSEALTYKRTKPPCRCNGERKRARIIKLTYGNTADPAAKRYSTLI